MKTKRIFILVSLVVLCLGGALLFYKFTNATQSGIVISESHESEDKSMNEINDIDSIINKSQIDISDDKVEFFRRQIACIQGSPMEGKLERYKNAYLIPEGKKQRIKLLVTKRYLKEGIKVLDFGCGMGAYTFPFSIIVGKSGKIYAVDQDIDSIIGLLSTIHSSGEKYNNIITRINDTRSSGISDPVDLIWISDVHIFSYDPDDNRITPGSQYTYGTDEAQKDLMQRMDKKWGDIIDNLYKATKKGGHLILAENLHCDGSKLKLSDESLIALFEKHNFHFKENLSSQLEKTQFVVFEK